MIKKYPNRRLYDTDLGEHITCHDVLVRIKRGSIPQIIDQATKLDVTSEVYASILVDLAKRGNVDADQLLALIRSSAEIPSAVA